MTSSYDNERKALEAQQRDIKAAAEGAANDRARARYRNDAETVKALDKELAGYAATLADLDSALRGLELAHAEANAGARADALQAKREAIVALTAQRISAAKAVDAAFKALRAALVDYGTAGEAARNTVLSSGPLIGAGAEALLSVGDLARGQAAVLQGSLHAAIANTGLHGFVDLKSFSDNHGSSVAATAAAESKDLLEVVKGWELA